MEILQHHFDLCQDLAVRKGTPEELASQHTESLRVAGHEPLPRDYSLPIDERSPVFDPANYQLDDPENFNKMADAVTKIIAAIRSGQVEIMPDFGEEKDIICESCAADICEKKKELRDEIIF